MAEYTPQEIADIFFRKDERVSKNVELKSSVEGIKKDTLKAIFSQDERQVPDHLSKQGLSSPITNHDLTRACIELESLGFELDTVQTLMAQISKFMQEERTLVFGLDTSRDYILDMEAYKQKEEELAARADGGAYEKLLTFLQNHPEILQTTQDRPVGIPPAVG